MANTCSPKACVLAQMLLSILYRPTMVLQDLIEIQDDVLDWLSAHGACRHFGFLQIQSALLATAFVHTALTGYCQRQLEEKHQL